jgi:hypothetical protein
MYGNLLVSSLLVAVSLDLDVEINLLVLPLLSLSISAHPLPVHRLLCSLFERPLSISVSLNSFKIAFLMSENVNKDLQNNILVIIPEPLSQLSSVNQRDQVTVTAPPSTEPSRGEDFSTLLTEALSFFRIPKLNS